MQARLATAEVLVAAAQTQLQETQASVSAVAAEVEYRRREHERIAALVASRSVNEAVRDEKLMQLRSAEAALAAAEARVQSMEAQVAVERTRRREAEANLVHAHAQLKVAEADREQTAVLMQYAHIRAPYDGIVTRRWVDTGDFVTSAAAARTEPLVTVERVDRLRILFDVPESESSLVAVGQPVRSASTRSRNARFLVEWRAPPAFWRHGPAPSAWKRNWTNRSPNYGRACSA